VADLSTGLGDRDVYEYEAAAVRLDQPATLTLRMRPAACFAAAWATFLPQ